MLRNNYCMFETMTIREIIWLVLKTYFQRVRQSVNKIDSNFIQMNKKSNF